MAKKDNKKNPQVEAPVVEKPEEKTPANKVDVLQVGDLNKLAQSYTKNGGLDPNHRVDVLMGIKTYFKDDPNAAANVGISQEAVDKINGIAAIGFVAALGDEIMMGDSSWAQKMRMTQVDAINAVNSITGISIDVKALPAPDAEGNVLVEKKNIKVSKITKENLDKIKKTNEEAKDKDYCNDPTKITNEEQLKEALGFQLVNSKIVNPIDKLIATSQFYRSYIEILAEKSDNPKGELDKIHGYTTKDLLEEIITMVPPTFVSSGYGKYICQLTANYGSIIPAFNNMKRSATNRKTKVCKFSDEEIATIIRVLYVWYITSLISNAGASIKNHEKNIKELSSNKEANAKAIEGENKKIEDCKAEIACLQAAISLATSPNYDVVDEFEDAYRDSSHKLHKSAEKIYDSIVETYYPDTEIDPLVKDSFLTNVKIHAGIITNLFNDALNQRSEFNKDALTYVPADEKPAEEHTSEEEPKNS